MVLSSGTKVNILQTSVIVLFVDVVNSWRLLIVKESRLTMVARKPTPPDSSVVPIYYISSIPGTGKTEAALAFMVDHLQKVLAGKSTDRIIYAVPSIGLLSQSQQRIVALIQARFSAAKARELISLCSFVVADDLRTFERTPVAQKTYQKLDEGKHLLFLTHQGFLLLRNHPTFKDTIVIFDEDRPWVSKVSNVIFEEDTLPLFDALFEVQAIENSICRLVPKKITSRAALKSIHRMSEAKVFNILYSLHRRISPDRHGNPARASAYGAVQRIAKSGSYRAVQVETPSKPFEGFKAAYILCANFARSQMWHLMYRDQLRGADIRLIDYTEPFLLRWAPELHARKLAIAHRYKKVVIIPLLANDDKILTSTAVGNGFIAKTFPGEVDPHWFKLKLRELRKAEQDPFDGNVSDFTLRKDFHIHASLPEWMIAAAREARQHWADSLVARRPALASQKEQFLKSKPLVFLNYGDMFRCKQRDYDGEFEWLEHAKARGMNRWSDANTIFYLAAVNADPVVSNVLSMLTRKPKSYLGEQYDVNYDYLGASLLQCAGRGNVRNHNSKSTMLVIVPTLRTAEYLKSLMLDFPSIYTGFAESNPWFLYSTIRFNGMKVGSSKLTAEERRRLASIKSQLSRAKKQKRTDEIERLVAERDAIWDASTQRTKASKIVNNS